MQWYRYLNMRLLEMPTGRTYLLGNKSFNTLSNGNGKSCFSSCCLKLLINFYYPDYMKAGKPSPPNICQKARHLIDLYSTRRQASLFQESYGSSNSLWCLLLFNYLTIKMKTWECVLVRLIRNPQYLILGDWHRDNHNKIQRQETDP